MSGYTPLFGSIITSSIWNESNETRIVWVTMLAMADMYGVVEGSVPGLAVVARVSKESCQKAIDALSAPDPDSRTKEYEGRRILSVTGGWKIVNHTLYRQKAKSRAEDQRRYRERRKEQTPNDKRKRKRKRKRKGDTARGGALQGVAQRSFVPPTIGEVESYCKERGYQVDARQFIEYYSTTDDGLWRDRDGALVKNWKKKIISVWSKKNGRTTENRGNTGTKPNTEFIR